jgi:hypothetical protein
MLWSDDMFLGNRQRRWRTCGHSWFFFGAYPIVTGLLLAGNACEGTEAEASPKVAASI